MLKFFVIFVASLSITLGSPTYPGNHDVAPRIVGGQETEISRYPWQLALLYNGQHFCGAVAIHPFWALTAAHCLSGAEVARMSVRAGSTTKSFGGQVIDVHSVYQHPQFNIRTNDYDYALLRLVEAISIQSAAFVALPEPNQDVLVGATAVITGWGTVDPDESSTPEILRMVQVPVVSQEICQDAYPAGSVTDRMFCAGDVLNGGKDSCRGDGGGPVLINGRLAGLVSWGSGCALPFYPGVYAKVSSVMEWVYETSGI